MIKIQAIEKHLSSDRSLFAVPYIRPAFFDGEGDALMETKQLIKELNRIALPLVWNNLLSMICALILAGITGHISGNALMVTGTIDGLIYAVIGILGAGTLAYVVDASRLQNQAGEVALDYFKSLLGLNLQIGLGFFVLTLFTGGQVLAGVYGFSGTLLSLAKGYLLILSVELVLTLTIFSLTNRLKVIKRTGAIFKTGVLASLLQIAVTFILLPLFTGDQKVMALGWAQIISELTAVLSYAWVLRKDLQQLRQVRSTRKNFLLRKSLTFFLQEMLEGSIFQIFLTTWLTRLGGLTFAAYQLCRYLTEVCLLPLFMYCNAMMILLGEKWQRRDQKLKHVPVVTLGLILAFFIVSGTLSYGFREILLSCLSDLPEVVRQAGAILGVVLITEGTRPFYEVSKYALQSSGREKTVLLITGLVNGGCILALLWLPSQLATILTTAAISNLLAAAMFSLLFRGHSLDF